jgi:hypothetical protein
MVEIWSTSSGGDGESKAMLDIATPDLYRANAFRVLGLPVTTTPGDLAKQRQMLKLMEKLKTTSPTVAGGYLPLTPAPDGDARRRANQRLHDPEARLVDELFWFWPLDHESPDEDNALQLLRSGDSEGAAAIWSELQNSGPRWTVAQHNLAILNHTVALDLEHEAGGTTTGPASQCKLDQHWGAALRHWRAASEDNVLWGHINTRIRSLDDPRLTTGCARRLRQLLPIAVMSVSVQLVVRAADRGDALEARRHLKYLRGSGFDLSVAGNILERGIEPVVEQVKRICEPVPAKSKADPKHATEVAERLLVDAGPRLAGIRGVLSEGHHLWQAASNTVAKTVRICWIDSCDEDWAHWSHLLGEAKQLAVDEDLRTWLDKDITQAQSNDRAKHEYEEMKEAIPRNLVYEVTVPRGQASVANICTCCLGKADGEQSVSHSWQETQGLTRYKRTLSFAFPICTTCRKHQAEYTRKRWLISLLAAGSSTLILWVIATQLNSADWLPFVLAGGVLTLVLLLVYSRFIRVSPLSAEHACRDAAVEMPSASDSDITFRFHNPIYAAGFANSNRVQVRQRTYTKPPRGTYLLSGRALAFTVLVSLIAGAIAHSIVFGMMDDQWKEKSTRYSGDGSGHSSVDMSPSPPYSPPPSPPAPIISGGSWATPGSASLPTIVAPQYSSSGLEAKIVAGKARVDTLDADMKKAKSTLESLSSRIDGYKRDIDGYESRSRLGEDVDRALYQQAIDEHNRLVDQYESLRADYNSKVEQYNSELRSVNSMVDRYNKGER